MSSDPPILYLLSGWAGAGKDAVAEVLVQERGFRRFAFADPLKAAVVADSGLPAIMFERPYKDRPLSPTDPRTPRDLLLVHAEAARASDPDIYARATVAAILRSECQRAVISDWRYRREEAFVDPALRAQGWHVVRLRIERPGLIPSASITEHDLDEVPMDCRIVNDGGLDKLRETVLFVCEVLG